MREETESRFENERVVEGPVVAPFVACTVRQGKGPGYGLQMYLSQSGWPSLPPLVWNNREMGKMRE